MIGLTVSCRPAVRLGHRPGDRLVPVEDCFREASCGHDSLNPNALPLTLNLYASVSRAAGTP